MSPNFQTALSKLERLSPAKLDKTSRRIRGAMADAEWKMGLCLLALKRSGAFRKLGFGTLSAYAERVLQLSGRKVGALLGAAEALEHLPLMSEAFRAGRVCWSKVRVMHGLATPETEAEWLEFARVHTSVEVERKVALSPLEWKRHRALKASLAGKPSVSSGEVKELLSSRDSVACVASSNSCSGRIVPGESDAPGLEKVALSEHHQDSTMGSRREVVESAAVLSKGEAEMKAAAGNAKMVSTVSSLVEDRPAPPAPPRTIRLVFELTPDQYALYEQAESRVRAREGRRLPRAEVLKRMAESVLSQGTAKSRARHQVLVHTMEGSDEAWYETERGVLPVASEVLEEALGGQKILKMDAEGRLESVPRDSLMPEESRVKSKGETKNAQDHECERTTPEKSARDAGESQDRRARPVDGPQESTALTGHRSASLEPHADHICDSPEENGTCSPPTPTSDHEPKRTALPNSTIRQVFARAGHRCECCGRKGGRLDVHHRDPVSEGGSNDPGYLELLCRACHTKNHQPDFEEKQHWRAAREAAQGRRSDGAVSAVRAAEGKQFREL